MKFFTFSFVASLCLLAVNAIDLEHLNGGVKCLLDVAVDARNITQQFNDDVKECPGIIDQLSQDLIDYMNEIAEMADEAFLIYDMNCKGYKLIIPLCKSKLSVQIIDIGIKVVPTIKLISEIIENPLGVNECVLKAAVKVENKLDALLDKSNDCISISF